MHIYVSYLEISQKLIIKPMYLYSTFDFMPLNTHDTPGGGGINLITIAGRIRLPSPIVKGSRFAPWAQRILPKAYYSAQTGILFCNIFRIASIPFHYLWLAYKV